MEVASSAIVWLRRHPVTTAASATLLVVWVSAMLRHHHREAGAGTGRRGGRGRVTWSDEHGKPLTVRVAYEKEEGDTEAAAAAVAAAARGEERAEEEAPRRLGKVSSFVLIRNHIGHKHMLDAAASSVARPGMGDGFGNEDAMPSESMEEMLQQDLIKVASASVAIPAVIEEPPDHATLPIAETIHVVVPVSISDPDPATVPLQAESEPGKGETKEEIPSEQQINSKEENNEELIPIVPQIKQDSAASQNNKIQNMEGEVTPSKVLKIEEKSTSDIAQKIEGWADPVKYPKIEEKATPNKEEKVAPDKAHKMEGKATPDKAPKIEDKGTIEAGDFGWFEDSEDETPFTTRSGSVDED